MRKPNGNIWETIAAPLYLGAACILVANAVSAAETVKVHLGKPVQVGNGTAWVQVVEDRSGVPTSVSVLVSEEALNGLPEGKHGSAHESHEYQLPMPDGSARTGFDHATIDWNPMGHEPNGVYSAPHFDVHFYVIDSAARNAITFKNESTKETALKQPAPDLVPAGYVVPPDTAVERMGVHGVDPTGSEFHGKPFTTTFIYGFYNGETIFVEPMVTKAFLETKPDVTMPVRMPKSFSHSGFYPDRYRVAYDPQNRTYVVALAGLHPWKMN